MAEGKGLAVIKLGPCGHNFIVHGFGEKAVHEIDVAAVLDALEEGAIALDDVNLKFPADLGDFQSIFL